jgi:hypothetical protein
LAILVQCQFAIFGILFEIGSSVRHHKFTNILDQIGYN